MERQPKYLIFIHLYFDLPKGYYSLYIYKKKLENPNNTE